MPKRFALWASLFRSRTAVPPRRVSTNCVTCDYFLSRRFFSVSPAFCRRSLTGSPLVTLEVDFSDFLNPLLREASFSPIHCEQRGDPELANDSRIASDLHQNQRGLASKPSSHRMNVASSRVLWWSEDYSGRSIRSTRTGDVGLHRELPDDSATEK